MIVDYSVRPNVIPRDFLSGERQEGQCQMRQGWGDALQRWRERPPAKKCRRPLEVGKGKDTGSTPRASRRSTALPTS